MSSLFDAREFTWIRFDYKPIVMWVSSNFSLRFIRLRNEFESTAEIEHARQQNCCL